MRNWSSETGARLQYARSRCGHTQTVNCSVSSFMETPDVRPLIGVRLIVFQQ